jgi:hypothetical protein
MKNLSYRSSALVLSLALGLLVTVAAKADTLTYNLVPIIYPDFAHTSDIDTVTGTFVISSTGAIEGTWSSSHPPPYPIDFTANLTMSFSGSVPEPTVSASESYTIQQMLNGVFPNIQGAGLTVSTTAVSVPNVSGSDGYFFLPVISGSNEVLVTWEPSQNEFSASTGQSYGIENTSGTAYYSSASSSSPGWVIATTGVQPIPEPGALSLTAIAALLGLGRPFLARLRRRIKTRHKPRCQLRRLAILRL